MHCDLIVIGGSLGGINAVGVLLAGLPPDFAIPIAIVLHRGVDAPSLLVTELRRRMRLKISEPSDMEKIRPRNVYIAPADYHLLVENSEFRLSTEATVNFARPSIDVLFLSAADSFGKNLVAVVLTGASGDGATGAARVQRYGGTVVAQSLEEAECPVMPRAALAAAPKAKMMTLAEITSFLRDLGASGGTR